MAEQPSPTFDQSGQSVGVQYNTAGDLHLHMAGVRPALWANVPSLPAEPLVGREALLAELVQGLTAGQARALSTDDQGGAGKTALALALAYDPRIGGSLAATGSKHFASQQALALQQAGDPGTRLAQDDAHVLDWVWALGTFWDRRELGADQIRWIRQALAVAEANGDVKTQAILLNNLGYVHDALGDWQPALDYFNQALPLYRQQGNQQEEATTLNNIGLVHDALGDKQQALAYLNQALLLRREVGDTEGEATTLHGLGAVSADLGDPQQTLAYYEQALPLYRRVGDRTRERWTRFHIAMICADPLGDLDRAVAELEQVVALDAEIRHPKLEEDQAALAQMRARQAGDIARRR